LARKGTISVKPDLTTYLAPKATQSLSSLQLLLVNEGIM